MILKIPDRFALFTDRRWNTAVLACHFIFAFCIFSPFFLSGQCIVGSTDNLGVIFPNMLFSHEAFNRGEPGLWNEYILGGIDFSASTHNYIYSPLNWLIFLFPQKWFFIVMTLRMFIEVWLVGVFAFLFFRQELKNREWAFFASTIYQLCGYTFFSIATYPNLTVYLFSIISLYVMWTMDQRKFYLSYVYLTFCLVSIVVSVNLIYSFAVIFMLAVLFFYKQRFADIQISRTGCFVVFCAGISALLISMVRIVPIVHEVLFLGTRMGAMGRAMGMGGEAGYTYMGITAFVPESMGIHLTTSIPIIESIMHFKENIIDCCCRPGNVKGISLQCPHAQFYAFTYFGAISSLLVLWAIIKIRERKAVFWVIYLMLSACALLYVQPVSDILALILYPLVHTIIPKTMIPIAFCALAGYGGLYIEKYYRETKKRDIAVLLTIIVIIVSSCFIIWGIYKPDVLLKPMKFMFTMSLAWGVYYWFFYRYHKGFLAALLGLAVSMVSVVAFFLFFKKFLYAYPETSIIQLLQTNFLFLSGSIYLSLSILSLVLILFFVLAYNQKIVRKKLQGFFLFVSICLAASLLFPFSPSIHEAMNGVPFLLTLAIVRFVLIGVIFIAVLTLLSINKLEVSRIFIVLFFVLLIDLLPYNKIYSNQVMKPFFKGRSLYPLQDNPDAISSFMASMDIKNFRVNNPQRILRMRGAEANIASVYKMRLYGGINSDVAKDSALFIRNFIPSASAGIGIVPDQKNERYLDMMGCRYDADENGKCTVRPNALSRFMLFKNFEVIKDEREILDRVRDPQFNPWQTVILSHNPGIVSAEGYARPADFICVKTSKIKVRVETDAAALLFFNDSYHPGWTAYVNGENTPVMRADYNFMAAVVPAGRSEVVFCFEPRFFYYGLYLTCLGIVVFILSVLWLYFSRRKIDAHNG